MDAVFGLFVVISFIELTCDIDSLTLIDEKECVEDAAVGM